MKYKLWLIFEECEDSGERQDKIETLELLSTQDKDACYDAFLTAQAATLNLIDHTHGKFKDD